MKNELIIIIACFFLVLGLSFLIYNSQNSKITGFAVNDQSIDLESINDNLSINQDIKTKEDILSAINESEKIIKELKENNLSVNYMLDSLIEAKLVFEQAQYAEILRGEINVTEKEKQEARDALRLIKWQNINYSDVLFFTDDIKNRKQKAFLLLDKINLEENNLKENKTKINNAGLFSTSQIIISNQTLDILSQAKIAFFEERYNDSENLLIDYSKAMEKEKADATILSGIKNGAKNFFQRYWIHIIVFLILLIIASYLTYKIFEKKILAKKIRKTKKETEVLNDLMKKTQIERFKFNKISGLVYNIRMKKYEERLQEIKEELPVLEDRLKKLSLQFLKNIKMSYNKVL